MQTIKKYANRKLYHTNRKQYITLDGIAGLIQAGEEVQVVDNETGEDITAPILAQVVLQSRGQGGRLSAHVLTGLIRAGGETIQGLRRSLWATLGGAALVEAEIRRRLDRLQAEGALDEDEVRRLRSLLLSEAAGAGLVEISDLPTRSDIAKLHVQVDVLAAAVERLLAERKGAEVPGERETR